MKKILISLIFCVSAVAAGAQSVSSLLVPMEMSPESAALEGVSHSGWAQFGKWAPGTADCTILAAGAYSTLGSKIALGLDVRSFKDSPYEVTNSSGISSGVFSPSDLAGALSVYYFINGTLGIGLTGRYVSSTISPALKGSAFCGDLSAIWKKDAFGAIAGVYNLGSKISYGKSSYSLPAFVRAGGYYTVSGVTIRAAADYLLEGAFGALVSAEYTVLDMVTPKVGYHYGNPELGLPSYALAGLKASFYGVGLSASYLFASGTLGGSLQFALSYSF